MKFRIITECFALIEQEQSRLKMTQMLANLLHETSCRDAQIIGNLVLGQLYPPYKGTQFGIAEKTMIAVVAQAMDVSVHAVTQELTRIGDLGSVIESTQRRVVRELTVQEVYDVLVNLESISGTGSQENKTTQLIALLQCLDPLSAKYVVRIILGKLRLGFSDMTIIDALSWMLVGNKSLRPLVEQAYTICADIGLLIEQAKEGGAARLEKMKIHVGIPIIPAAAERMPTAEKIMDKLGPCVAQLKLDGFRLQVHIWSENGKRHIKFYSRNLQDMSSMFPDLEHALLPLPVDSLICEGEAIGYNAGTESFLPFQETVKRKRKHNILQTVSELPLRLFLFDLLYVNGVSCLDMPHEVRRKGLLELIEGLKSSVIQVDEERPIKTSEELESYFNYAISAGLEGLVVKKPEAVYQAGKRNFNWIKLKRQHIGHIEDTIDVVIVGYYYGGGKRASFGIGAFLAAVYNEKHDTFQTIAKVGTGLSDSAWKELKKRCDAQANSKQPKNVVCAPELVPDVWVSPEIVVALRADEITLSPLHSAGKTEKHLGYALRFPRFIEYRPDKNPVQATTVGEIVTMYKDQWER